MVNAGDTLRTACHVVEQALIQADCPDATFDAQELCLLATGVSVYRAPEHRMLSASEAVQLNTLTQRRANREPLQYLCGKWGFFNFELTVGKGVLCPRADTEVVAEYAAACLLACFDETIADTNTPHIPSPLPKPFVQGLRLDLDHHAPQSATPQVLELCGGTGCIGLALKAFCPSANITVLEKSSDALPYLRENATHALDELLPVTCSPYVDVVEGDLFTYHRTLPDGAFEVLVSNPPYLTTQEMAELQPEVAQEPAMALEAGVDGLQFYRAIASDYRRVVKRGGYLILEIGATQAQDVMALLTQAGWYDIVCKQDYAQKDRCVIARCL